MGLAGTVGWLKFHLRVSAICSCWRQPVPAVQFPQRQIWRAGPVLCVVGLAHENLRPVIQSSFRSKWY